jgi:hypothetical protein
VLDVSLRGSVLDISIINHGSEPTRIWNRSNSWGWRTLSLEIEGAPPERGCYKLSVKPASFTKNGPGFTEIPANGSHRITTISAGNPEWNGIERVEHLRDETLWARAYLRIPPSPEADTYGVFVGEVSSPQQESHPPHRWLFSDS